METFKQKIITMAEQMASCLNVKDEQTLLAIKIHLKDIAVWSADIVLEEMESHFEEVKEQYPARFKSFISGQYDMLAHTSKFVHGESSKYNNKILL